jgi:peptidyl-prolyl cis-trans isomerase B (cyclophilin B)
MNRKEREKYDLHTGKIKYTPEELQKKEEEQKQKRIQRNKQRLIVLSSIVGAAILIVGIASYFNWQTERKAEMATWPPDVKKPTSQEIKEIKEELVVMETTMGTIKIALDPEAAPLTVNNFRQLIKQKHYDGVLFHRVIKDFMIQGGGYDANGVKDVQYSFKDEINPWALGLDEATIQKNITAKKYKYDKSLPSLKMEYGALAMANAGANTNGSQFFIVTDPKGSTHLNGLHTVFGKVVEGMEVALKIQAVQTGEADKPVTDVYMTKVYLETKPKKTE